MAPSLLTRPALLIDGQLVETAGTFPVVNPATEETIAEAPQCTREQLDRAVEAATRAFATWRTDVARRRAVLSVLAERVLAHADELAALLSSEQGKPEQFALREIKSVANEFLQAAKQKIPVEVLLDDASARCEIRRVPLGVTALITPWNFPLNTAAVKMAPALLIGNTIIFKPSPNTPLAALRFAQIVRDAVPRGVLNVVTGTDELGPWITSHPGIKKFSFTGSVATGKKIMAACAAHLTRVTLELGGNDAAIVLEDADLALTAEKLTSSAFYNAGQVCVAVKRVYVHRRVHDELAEACARIARTIRLGSGADPAAQMGPLNNRAQLERVTRLVDDARDRGAQILCGGQRVAGPGYFYAPTVVTQIRDGAPLVDEEQFGPVLPFIAFDDVEEAVAAANRSPFGLAASVWTKDLTRGTALAERLEAGRTGVNIHAGTPVLSPFGGFKSSGIGREHGIWGLDAMSELQVVTTMRK